MDVIAIGLDVSKGRADIAIINQSGTLLAGSGGYDDTRAGHDRWSAALTALRRQYPDARLVAGVEATGGYERSWVAFFQRDCRLEEHVGHAVAVHRLNPLAVKRFLDADLHRKVDDAQAARGIARYLLERLRDADPQVIPLDGRVTFYRNIRGLIEQRTILKQRFLALLSAANPELVQFCDSGIPEWILLVCRQYPTAAALARCHRQALADIPHVGTTKADLLRAAAKTSTAAMDDAGTAAAVGLLVEELQHFNERIANLQAALIEMMKTDPSVALIDGIPGISPWSAAAIRLEIGDVERFADVRQLVAWAGLDPRVDTSGDLTVSRGISHRGNSHLRAILFPLAMAAMQHHPIVGEFIRRKIAEGKPKKVALVAGAAKLLRIIYALLITKRAYDPTYAMTHAKPAADQRQAQRAVPATEHQTLAPTPTPDLTAPVSVAERKRRRQQLRITENNAAARTPQGCEVEPLKRGRQAAAPPVSTSTS